MIYRVEETPSNEGTSAFEIGLALGWKGKTTKGIEVLREKSGDRIKIVFTDGSWANYPASALAIFEHLSDDERVLLEDTRIDGKEDF